MVAMISRIDLRVGCWDRRGAEVLLTSLAIRCSRCGCLSPIVVGVRRRSGEPYYAAPMSAAICAGWKITIDPVRATCPGCEAAR
jgi:hypothetical protein